ncbi:MULTISPECIES: hypothetical protein [Dermacoccus]|uniref:hypothetical protein n=1 Tax=Dermacoccus TaxID=57495 RepID=UPI000A4EF7FE|nr:hypothetical protein [Dermacoccus nishinomiyaensis]
MLHRHRGRSSGFGYSHVLIWPALAAVGGGLHVMAQAFENVSVMHVDPVVLAICTIVP